jgi:hypothetical protein
MLERLLLICKVLGFLPVTLVGIVLWPFVWFITGKAWPIPLPKWAEKWWKCYGSLPEGWE